MNSTEVEILSKFEQASAGAMITALNAHIAKLVDALEEIVNVYESGNGECLDLRMSDIARKALAL